MNGKWTWGRGVLLASWVMASGLALAERPDWAGQGGRGKHRESEEERHYERERERDRRDYQAAPYAPHTSVDIRIGGYFGSAQRIEVGNYYREQYHGGSCPPGLAKKHNGCMPPGQARKWALGQPLPRDVAYYPVEPGISVRLGVPPSGYKYVRVASDILLIAVGSSLVVDAIRDLGRQ